MKKRWQMLQPDISSVRKISKALKCHPIIASILVNRNIVSAEDAFDFLNPSFNNMRSPFSIKGMNTAVGRILLLRASALSYTTLLAIIPIFAIAFSMLKGLGFHTRLENLINYLTAGQEELTNRTILYISNTNFKAMGVFGTALLIYASVMMLSNVERTFNELWGVSRQRTVARKISNYISFLFIGPFLMILSTAMIASFSSNTFVAALTEYQVFKQFFVLFYKIIPHATLWIAFTAMYYLMPNTGKIFTCADRGDFMRKYVGSRISRIYAI